MSGPPPSRARRRRFALALLALAPALLGCQQIGRGLERAVHAFVYVVSASVAVLALVVAALALDRLRRPPPTAERPRRSLLVLALAGALPVLGLGTFGVLGALQEGVPLDWIALPPLGASALWALALPLGVASGTAQAGPRASSAALGGLYLIAALATVVHLWPGPRLPAGAAAEVSVGPEWVCVRFERGEVVCDGHRPFRGTSSRWPVPVDAPPAVSLHAGETRTCLRTDEGEVWCWGERRERPERVATGAPGGDALRLVGDELILRHGARWERADGGPAVGGWLDGADAVATERGVCRLDGETVRCGRAHGPLGEPLPEAPELGPADALRAGERRVCAWRGATVRCQGRAPEGGAVTLPGPPAELAVARWHACARGGDGRVRCWGRGGAGKLGRPGGEDADEPVDVGLEGVTQLAARGELTCAVARGTVSCWGVVPAGVRLHGDAQRAAVRPIRALLGGTPRFYDRPASLRWD